MKDHSDSADAKGIIPHAQESIGGGTGAVERGQNY